MARTNSLFSSRVLRSRAKNVSQAAQTQVMSVLQGRSYNNILPYELWLAIFHHLTLSETLVIGQVNRFFCQVSRSIEVWRNFAYELMQRGRRIELYDHASPNDLTADELRLSVLLATRTEQVWLEDQAKYRARCPVIRLRRRDRIDPLVTLIRDYSTSRHLVFALQQFGCIGVDPNKIPTAKSISKHELRTGDTTHFIDREWDYESRTLWNLVYSYAALLPQLVSHTFIIVAITYPKLDSDDELCFREVDRFRCEVPMLSEAHLLSYRRKMMLAISQDSDSSFAILYIVLDWSTGKCFRLNTFEKYEYGKSVIKPHLSQDGRCLIFTSISGRIETKKSYRLSDIEHFSSTMGADYNSAVDTIPLTHEATHEWRDTFGYLLDNNRLVYTWTLEQSWPTFKGIPPRTSTISIYHPMAYPDPYLIAQHYKTNEEATSKSRFIMQMHNPVISPTESRGVPLLCLSFNHIGYIQFVNAILPYDHHQSRTTKRVFKLVTFPDPDVCPSTISEESRDSRGRTIDIPQSVLRNAIQLAIDSATGTIIIVTAKSRHDEIHIFRF